LAGREGKENIEVSNIELTLQRTSRRRVPGEEGEDTEEVVATEAAEGAATTETAKPKSKRKPKAKKEAVAASEARIDGGQATEAETKDKPVREKKERKPREKKMAPSGEDSKVSILTYLSAARFTPRTHIPRRLNALLTNTGHPLRLQPPLRH
jgi:hypothetical protein